MPCYLLTESELAAMLADGYVIASGPHATEEECTETGCTACTTLGLTAYGVVWNPPEAITGTLDTSFNATLTLTADDEVWTPPELITGALDTSFNATLTLTSASAYESLVDSYTFTLSGVADDGCEECPGLNATYTITRSGDTWYSDYFDFGDCAPSWVRWRMRLYDHGFGLNWDLELIDDFDTYYVRYTIDPDDITDPTDFTIGLNGYLGSVCTWDATVNLSRTAYSFTLSTVSDGVGCTDCEFLNDTFVLEWDADNERWISEEIEWSCATGHWIATYNAGLERFVLVYHSSGFDQAIYWAEDIEAADLDSPFVVTDEGGNTMCDWPATINITLV